MLSQNTRANRSQSAPLTLAHSIEQVAKNPESLLYDVITARIPKSTLEKGTDRVTKYPIVGKLPYIDEVRGKGKQDALSKELFDWIANEIGVIAELTGILLHDDIGPTSELRHFADAILYFKLKTGESLSQFIVDTVYVNQSVLRKDYYGNTQDEDSGVGKLIALNGLPAVGKSLLGSHLRNVPDPSLLIMDGDVMRASLLGSVVLKNDQELFRSFDNAEYHAKQYLYNKRNSELFSVIARSLASVFTCHGYTVITNGMWASNEADQVVYIETDETSKDDLIRLYSQQEIPSKQQLETLLNNCDSPEDIFIDGSYAELKIIYDRVKNRVHKREQHNVSDIYTHLNYSQTVEPIIANQRFGINPLMNDADILRVISGIAEDMSDLNYYQPIQTINQKEVLELVHDSSKIKNICERLGIASQPKNLTDFYPWVRLQQISSPRDVLEERGVIVKDAARLLKDLVSNIEARIKRSYSSFQKVSNAKFNIHHDAKAIIAATVSGSFGSLVAKREYQKLWSDLTGAHETGKANEELRGLIKFLLYVTLHAKEKTELGLPKFQLPQRFDPVLKGDGPAIIHSAFTLVKLGKHLFGDTFGVKQSAVCFFHDIREEAMYQPASQLGLSAARLYSSSKEGILRLHEMIREVFPADEGRLIASSVILSESRTDEVVDENRRRTQHLFEKFHRTMLDHQVDLCGLESVRLQSMFHFGPLNYALESLQKTIGIQMLVEKATSMSDESGDECIAFAEDLLMCAVCDRYDDLLTLARYLPEMGKYPFTPEQVRLKILSYGARLLHAYGQLTHALDALPQESQMKFGRAFRDYIPTLHAVIDTLINPYLSEHEVPILKPLDIHDFYRSYFESYMSDLADELHEEAQFTVERALDYYLESRSLKGVN